MAELYFCCIKCGKLHIGTVKPSICADKKCGGTEFKQGLEYLGYAARQELAAHRRKQDNEPVKRQYYLKPKKGK